MQPLPDLFPEIDLQTTPETATGFEQQPQHSKGRRIQNVFVGSLVVGLAVSTGAIAFYGIGPILSPPAKPQIVSTAPDAAAVLGLHDQPNIQDVFSQEEKSILIQNLASHVQIPEGETNATVLGITELPTETEGFLSKAEVGDAVIIFPKSKLAYLYRPKTDEVVATGTVNEK